MKETIVGCIEYLRLENENRWLSEYDSTKAANVKLRNSTQGSVNEAHEVAQRHCKRTTHRPKTEKKEFKARHGPAQQPIGSDHWLQ
jgi:hypothetical protein